MKNDIAKSTTLPLVALLFAAACSTPVEKLNPEAASVTVLDSVSLADLDRLQRSGTGSCEIGSNARTHESNIIACKNYLRNEAAKKNADFIVYTSTMKKGATTGSVEATFYKQRNVATAR
jgi:hypothetical protein